MNDYEKKIKYCPSISFGLQQFDDVRVAFWVMSGEWGDEEVVVIDERIFLERVLFQAINALWLKEVGVYSEEKCSSLLWKSEQKSHYLIDFNFFIYCKKNNCLYTCLKNDKFEWDERQCRYLQDVYDTYSFSRIVEFAEKKSKEYLNNKRDNAACQEFLDYCWAGCDDLIDEILDDEAPYR